MKSEPQTQRGTVMDAPCLLQAAAVELAKHRSVEAIAIKAVEGKISIATIGRVADASVAERIQESLAKVQADSSAETCRLLQADPSCTRCEHPMEPIRQQGFAVTRKRRSRYRGAGPLPHRSEVLALAGLSAAKD